MRRHGILVLVMLFLALLSTATHGYLAGTWDLSIGTITVNNPARGSSWWECRQPDEIGQLRYSTRLWLTCAIKSPTHRPFVFRINGAAVAVMKTKSSDWEVFYYSLNPGIIRSTGNVIKFGTEGNNFPAGTHQYRDLSLHYTPYTAHLNSTWYRGTIHVHSNHSDGTSTIAERAKKAREMGLNFIVMTDHYEQARSKSKGGFSSYLKDCSKENRGGLIVVPGFEIMSKWHAESNTTDYSHTLALGWHSSSSDAELDKFQGQYDTEGNILFQLKKLGLVIVAAHPTCISTKYQGVPLPKWTRFRFDVRSLPYFSYPLGTGIFNGEDSGQKRSAVDLFLSWMKDHRNAYVTGDNDSHSPVDLEDIWRWQRQTMIWAEGFSEQSLLHAMLHGATIALANGARVNYMNIWPRAGIEVIRYPVFYCKIIFEDPKKAGKQIKVPYNMNFTMYRDGVAVSGSVRSYKKGANSVVYQWTDTSVPYGVHWYNLYGDECFITSPIKFDITPF